MAGKSVKPAAEARGGKNNKRPRGGIAKGGPAVASRTLGMLGTILERAVHDGVLAKNPTRGIKRPKDQEVKPAFSFEKVEGAGRSNAGDAAENAGTERRRAGRPAGNPRAAPDRLPTHGGSDPHMGDGLMVRRAASASKTPRAASRCALLAAARWTISRASNQEPRGRDDFVFPRLIQRRAIWWACPRCGTYCQAREAQGRHAPRPAPLVCQRRHGVGLFRPHHRCVAGPCQEGNHGPVCDGARSGPDRCSRSDQSSHCLGAGREESR